MFCHVDAQHMSNIPIILLWYLQSIRILQETLHLNIVAICALVNIHSILPLSKYNFLQLAPYFRPVPSTPCVDKAGKPKSVWCLTCSNTKDDTECSSTGSHKDCGENVSAITNTFEFEFIIIKAYFFSDLTQKVS